MQSRKLNLDRFDWAILQTLSGNGRITVTELAKRIGLSKSPTQARLKRLEQQGAITGYKALVDPIRLGRDHVCFVEVRMTDTREPALAEFKAEVTMIPEVEQAHMIAGEFDYLLKIRTRSMTDYRKVLGEKILSLPHVGTTSTFVAMEAAKESVTAPLK